MIINLNIFYVKLIKNIIIKKEKEAVQKPSKAEDCNDNKKDDGYCCMEKVKVVIFVKI